MENYKEEILKFLPIKGNIGYTEYGSKVVPVIKLYKELSTYEERSHFQDALEEILSDKNEEIRKFGVDICLGFFAFRKSFD
ncbi:MAG: hypothetical protein JW915_19480 [Chitinispirillaceae bacterium]|nr:hypothetical protein [Chitinispirillaceae bacterium]